MSELSGTSAVAIESVEWSAESGGNLTVRITGRWRRRRPVSTGQPTLVIESEGRRHRYPAMPEPPSVGGTGPGVWRLSFTIPGWMAPELGRTWLQFGTVIVPLPVAVPAPGEGSLDPGPLPNAPPPSGPEPPEPPASASERPPPPPTFEPKSEAEAESEPEPDEPDGPPDFEPARGVVELTQRVDALEDELRDARAVRDELAASLEERERKRRIAEQRAHAEQALRRDLARQLSSSAREAERARQAMGELAAAEERIRSLEEELGQARRRSDEAEQVAAAATAARQRAEREREVAEQTLQRRAETGSAESARLHFERELRGRWAGQVSRIPSEPAAGTPSPVDPPVEPSAPAPTSAPPVSQAPAPPSLVSEAPAPPLPEPPAPPPPVSEPPAPPPPVSEPPAPPSLGLVASLRAELDLRARADAGLRARLIDAESRLAARVILERRTSAALAELRAELNSLGGELTRERTLRVEAERRTAELERELRNQRGVSLAAYQAIGELREALVRLSAPPEPEPEAEPKQVAVAEPEPGPQPVAVTEPAPRPQPVVAVEPAPPVANPAPPKPEPAPPVAQLAPPAPEPAPAPAPAAAPALLPAPTTAAAVEPARLNDALSRLRETIAPQGAPAAPSTAVVRTPSMHEALARPSLERAFRTMARSDLDAAGRLLLELLPLQRVVYPQAIAYDLVLAPDRCVWVSVPNGTPTIEVQAAPRPRQEVDFQVIGEPARIARLLTAGRLRRIFGRRGARVRGRREGVAALSALLGAPLDLGALHRAGIRPDPLIALGLLGAMIDPAWTATERFTFAHATPGASRTYLVVHEGRPLTATRIAPEGGPSTTMHCPTDDLLAALAGEPVPGVRVDGEVGAFLSLRKWIKRAQSE